MGNIKQGAYNAINVGLSVQPKEKVVIISERPTIQIGEALRDEAEKITDNVKFFVMEDYGSRPVAFPEEIGKEYENADVSIYAAAGIGDEIKIFRTPMIRSIHANPDLRHAHLIGIDEKIMQDGMCTDFYKVKKVGEWLYDKLKEAIQIEVTSPAGGNLKIEFTPSFEWSLSDGFIVAGKSQNLPPGEVFTTPINTNGKMVIDGCLGDYFAKEYGDLASSPITLEIKNNWAVKGSVSCQNLELQNKFSDYLFNQDENSSRVGEFAFGINVELKGFVGNLLQDEKFPGVHLGFGATSPEKTHADWDCDTHIDGVMRQTTAYIDGELVMKNGKYLMDN